MTKPPAPRDKYFLRSLHQEIDFYDVDQVDPRFNPRFVDGIIECQRVALDFQLPTGLEHLRRRLDVLQNLHHRRLQRAI